VTGMTTMALAPGFVVLCIGRLIFSIGMNAHMVGAPKLIGNWFAGRRHLGLAMGLYTLAFTAGVFLSLDILGHIADARGWRPAVELLALLSVAGLILVAIVPGAPENDGENVAPADTGFHPFALPLGAWVLAIAYFGYSIGTEGYLTFAPDYLVQRGLALSAASSVIGAYALIAFVLKPVLSAFLRPGRAIAYVVAATLTALVSVRLLFVVALPPLASSAVFGVSLALGMPAFLALPTFLLPAAQSGQGYGLYQLLYSLGFFAQPIVGAVVDRGGGYAPAFAVVALYTLLGLAVALPIVRRLPRTPATGG
jgi:MFS family permease